MDVETVKALILAGRTPHDRPWPSHQAGPKHLVPVANRPILFHNLESLRRSKVMEATIALDPEGAETVMAAVGDGSELGISVQYVPWVSVAGVIGALDAARRFIGDDRVLVQPADALHRERIQPLISDFVRDRLDAMVLRLSGGSRFVPNEPVGGYVFSRRAVSILLEEPAALTDPLARVREGGGLVRAQTIDGCLPCHGGEERLLEGNRRMLEAIEPDVDPAAYPTCEFQGAVRVHPTARLEHTLVRGPAIIGRGAQLSHSYVGPYTSIGSDVTIEGSQIEHSIVLRGAQLLHVGARLETSVIGRNTRIDRSFALPNAMRLSVGDGARLTLS
jgi:glucose-1-phosphate thymidylyltransferase